MVRFITAGAVLCLFVSSALAQAANDCKNDWPALARYHDDNQKTVPPARNEQRVVFMGDSITDSWDARGNSASHTSIVVSVAKPHHRC
jgi:hypothetical protein